MAEGYRDFVAGETLTAGNLEDYCQNQSVMRFASAAARDAALSVVKTEGMCAFLEDTNCLTVYSGSAWSSVGPVHGAGLSYTPTLTQSGSVSFTVGTSEYFRVGRMITWRFAIAVTGTGTGANAVTLTVPVTASYGGEIIGNAQLLDTSAAIYYQGMAQLVSTTAMSFRGFLSTNGYLGATGFTAALAAGDTISGFVTYAAAADA